MAIPVTFKSIYSLTGLTEFLLALHILLYIPV